MLGLAAQPLADLDAAGSGHHHVEAHEVGGVLGDRTERRVAVGGLDDVVPLPLHELAEQRPRRRLVVDGEDQRPFAAHGSRPVTVSAKVAKSMGLLRYSSNPAAMARSRSPTMAWAVKATMRSPATAP